MRAGILLLWYMIAGFKTIWAGDSLFISRLPLRDFIHPLAIPPEASGSFGEPRRLHFHTGIDFKTQQREGIDVWAAADGWISRVVISGTGYGNALYISHANGYVTVYGHLQRFAPEIQAWIRKIQYSQKKSWIDYTVPKGEMLIRQGEVIAYSGNSGGSGGPHLHFEIRDSLERILNPALMGCGFPDNDAPRFSAVKIYPADDRKHIGGGLRKAVEKKGEQYFISDTLRVHADSASIAVQCSDWVNNKQNAIGLWDLQCRFDDTLIYRFTANRFSFDEKRCVCAHTDYTIFMREDQRVFHKCFIEPGNHAEDFYPESRNRGIFHLKKNRVHRLDVIASDIAGNTASLTCHVMYEDTPSVFFPAEDKSKKMDFLLLRSRMNELQQPGFRLKVPGVVLYDDMPVSIRRIPSVRKGTASDGFQIADDTHILDKEAEIYISPFTAAQRIADKLVVVQEDAKGKVTARKSERNGDMIKAVIREFGLFYILPDTTAPSVKPIFVTKGKPNRLKGSIPFQVKDNLSGIRDMDAYVDGRWEVLTYDAKSNRLAFTPEENFSPGAHSIRLRVTDEKENETTGTWSFIW